MPDFNLSSAGTKMPDATGFADVLGPEMMFFNEVSAEMDKVYRHTRSWVHIETPKGSAALFSSGFGDGMYASYFGLDDIMEPVTLITDFCVSDWHRAE